MQQQKIIQVQDKVPIFQWIPLSLQHMFAMFGASVLVPILFHINPAVVLLMNGVATLLFIFITKGKSPAYLGSSFAFLGPAGMVIGTIPAMYGANYQLALGGFVAVGVVGMIVSVIIWRFGTKWVDILLPAAAMGPVVALIGMELAGTAASNAGIIATASAPILPANMWVFLITLAMAVFGSVMFRKFFAVIPILSAIIVGYAASLIFGIVDFKPVAQASWFSLPNFQLPVFKWDSMLTILPAILVIITEHTGHQIVTSKIVGKDLLKDPGLHRSMFADFFSTALSGMVGSVPTTTYGENIGVMAVTKVYSVRVIGGAAVISMIIAFIGKISTFIQTIPWAVIGGVSFLLYGMIAAAGIRIMVEAKVDYAKSRNLALTAVVFITGLSGVSIQIGSLPFKGMVLAAVVGMLLSLVFYLLDKAHLTNDREEANAEAAEK